MSSQLVHDGEALSPFLLFLRGAKRALRRCAGDVEATEACAALLHALTAAASDAELAHMLNGEHRVVEALAGADSKRRESQYLRTAIRTGLGNLALANQPTMEELLLRLRGPGAAKTDAELARERMEGAMDDAEKQFMDLPSETHAQNIMDICDRVVKNDKLTISELQIGLDDAVYGEVVAWILGDRHRVFREIDADHSHTLELGELVRAVDLFKQLREDERAREDYDREMAVKEAEDLAAGVARDRARRESYATAKRLRAESAARRRSPAEVAARGIMRHEVALHCRSRVDRSTVMVTGLPVIVALAGASLAVTPSHHANGSAPRVRLVPDAVANCTPAALSPAGLALVAAGRPIVVHVQTATASKSNLCEGSRADWREGLAQCLRQVSGLRVVVRNDDGS